MWRHRLQGVVLEVEDGEAGQLGQPLHLDGGHPVVGDEDGLELGAAVEAVGDGRELVDGEDDLPEVGAGGEVVGEAGETVVGEVQELEQAAGQEGGRLQGGGGWGKQMGYSVGLALCRYI